jgi:hypothetical protein
VATWRRNERTAMGCSELVFVGCWNLALEIQACLFGYLHGGVEEGSHDPQSTSGQAL